MGETYEFRDRCTRRFCSALDCTGSKIGYLHDFLHFSDIQRLHILSNTPNQLISNAWLERDFVLVGL
jgi:hypothetical protein